MYHRRRDRTGGLPAHAILRIVSAGLGALFSVMPFAPIGAGAAVTGTIADALQFYGGQQAAITAQQQGLPIDPATGQPYSQQQLVALQQQQQLTGPLAPGGRTTGLVDPPKPNNNAAFNRTTVPSTTVASRIPASTRRTTSLFGGTSGGSTFRSPSVNDNVSLSP